VRWAEVRGAYAGRARRLCDGSVEAMVGRLRADWAGLYRSATVVHRWQVGGPSKQKRLRHLRYTAPSQRNGIK
jgi:hypothetical protein